MLSVLVADDHFLVRKGLIQLLQEHLSIGRLDEAGDGNEVLELARSTSYDLMILDFSMPGKEGLDLIRDLKDIDASTHVIILSILPEDRARAILGTGPLPRINERTVTDPEEVLREAAHAREVGYGFDREEYETGLTCMALAIGLPEADFYGAMSVSGPTARMRDPVVRDRMLDALRRSTALAVAALRRESPALAAGAVPAVFPAFRASASFGADASE